ncbi:MAG: KEOPS complex subunit Pcc1, partial [Methanobacteriaceae archaeon]
VFESLNIDNKGFVESEIDDLKKNTINFNINSDSLSTFLATVDDLILCEILIEDVLESTR